MKQKTPSCEPRTAVIYARYSSAGQRDVSIEQQLRDVRAFAEREGYLVIREYCDRAKSGYKNVGSRTEFQRMMKDAESGSFDTVLAWKVDRFGRSREDSAIYKGRLKRFGVSVVYAMEPIPEGAAGVLLEGMLEATAEWYSRNLSENVLRGMQDNANKCLYNGGTRVLGYRRGADGRYEIDPETSPIIRAIFDQYSEGLSAARIADDLNARGIRTVMDARWNSQTVLRILKNERYIGTYIWGSYRTENGMPAIISRAQWDAVQTSLHRSRRVVRQGETDYLLTGKLFCGHCGSTMVGDSGTGKSGSKFYYYSCLSRKRRKGCQKNSVRKDDIENKVINYLLDTILTDDMIDLIAEQTAKEARASIENSDLPLLEHEEAEVRKQIRNINLAIAQGVFSSSTVVMLQDLESQAEELRRAIGLKKAAQQDLVTPSVVKFWLHKFSSGDRQDPRFRTRLIHTFVNSIYVYDDYLRIFINTVGEAIPIPFSSLPPCSDDVTDGPPLVIYPNTAEFRIAI